MSSANELSSAVGALDWFLAPMTGRAERLSAQATRASSMAEHHRCPRGGARCDHLAGYDRATT